MADRVIRLLVTVSVRPGTPAVPVPVDSGDTVGDFLMCLALPPLNLSPLATGWELVADGRVLAPNRTFGEFFPESAAPYAVLLRPTPKPGPLYPPVTPASIAPAEAHGMRSVDLAGLDIPSAVIELVPESVARENLVLPLSLDGNTLTLVAAVPDDDVVEKLRFVLNKNVVLVLAVREQIAEAINRHYGQTETESVDSMLHEFPTPGAAPSPPAAPRVAPPPAAHPPVPTTAPPAPTASPPARRKDEAAPSRPDEDEDEDFDDEFGDEEFDDEEFDDELDDVEDEEPDRAGVAETEPPLTGAKGKSSGKARPRKTEQRRATVRYYSRMNPERVFPLLFILTREEVEKVVKRHVEQAATGPLKLDADTPVEIEPVLPGCAVYPPKVVTRLGAADQSFTFHVVPHVVGDVTGARVFVRQDHAVLAEIALDVRVVQRTWVMVSGLSTVALPVASAAMKHFGLDFSAKDGGNLYLSLLDLLFGVVPPAVLMAALAVVTGVAWWLTRPKGRDVFWDISTRPAK